MTTVISKTRTALFEPPQLGAFPQGLYKHVNWQTDDHFAVNDGVVFKKVNTGFEDQFGVIDQPWCSDLDPGDALIPARPEDAYDDSDPFTHETVWAGDQNECGDLSVEMRAEVRQRVETTFNRLEQVGAERTFAARLLADVTAQSVTVGAATSIKDAIGQLTDAAAEAALDDLYIHMRPYYAMQEYGLFTADLKTSLGLTIVIGGGYVDGLSDTLVLTTPVYGWRSDVNQIDQIEHRENRAYSLAERSVLLGYEKIIAAVEIS